MPWLTRDDLRVGLGCMRLSTRPDRDEAAARAVVHAALDEGFTLFDTAHAYGRDESEYGHNERWLGAFLKGRAARVITKGGMRRLGPRWMPDGRAATLRSQCEASRSALGRPIDLYLLHAPDPRVPLSTSVRELERLRSEGLVRAVGVCNVTRSQLDEAMDCAELSAVQLGVSLLDDSALAGGVVSRALERGLTVICHSPLGGPKRYPELARQAFLQERARTDGCTVHEWALAALLALDENVVVIPGARRVETVRSSRKALEVKLPEEAAAVLKRFLASPRAAPVGEREVLLLMGLQGAGKTTQVQEALAAGAQRLNRDEAGGSLDKLHGKLDELLRLGARRVVLDNTYVTREQRRGALEVAAKHQVPVRGVWNEIELPQAQVNVVLRMLEVHGRLLTPEELKRSKTPDSIGPSVLARTAKTLERPEQREGFSSLELRPFVRRPWPDGTPALFVGLEHLGSDGHWDAAAEEAIAASPGAPVVLLGWKDGGVKAPPGVLDAVCPHPGGPPTCWCRPPLPGLVLALARTHGLSIPKSRLLTSSAVLAGLGHALGLLSFPSPLP